MIQVSYSLSRHLDCSTAQPFPKVKKKKKWVGEKKNNKRNLTIEIHLKAYAMNKNVTSELFLEIINNKPFFNIATKL